MSNVSRSMINVSRCFISLKNLRNFKLPVDFSFDHSTQLYIRGNSCCQYDILIQHENWILMSTNKSSICSVNLEMSFLIFKILINSQCVTFSDSVSTRCFILKVRCTCRGIIYKY